MGETRSGDTDSAEPGDSREAGDEAIPRAGVCPPEPSASSGPADEPDRARPPRSRRRGGWAARLLTTAGWAATAAAALGVALYYGVSERFSAVLLASFAPYLMLGSGIGLVLFAIARRFRAVLVALAVLLGGAWTQLPLFVADGHPGGLPFVVIQANLLYGAADADVITATARENKADLLTVEELTGQAVAGLSAAGIDTELPYHYLRPGGGASGSGIYSRYPMRDEKRFDGFVMANLGAVLDHPLLGPLPVFAFHPVPPSQDYRAWRIEMGLIRDILANAPTPAVAGGDFNATRDHAAFRALLGGRFGEAADLAGAGPQLTFPADRRWGPIIGIDHVLVAAGAAESVRTVVVPGSDHRSVLARVLIGGNHRRRRRRARADRVSRTRRRPGSR
ncbi:endonuclease/exonuclease/phosphatase family protein [Nocardia sp. NBC_01377]|uniref:endonuclease/exonuclease/phosphatase family protein n=1 Tax=Nocardia sp. NBC_01377 TaxID=2903595 RepID=UPI0032539BAE